MNKFATTASGFKVPFDILFYVLHDLCEFGDIRHIEYTCIDYWLKSHERGDMLPGTMEFRSPLSGDMVTYPWLIDDLYMLFKIADDKDKENQDPNEPIGDLFSEYMDMPIHLGRFGWMFQI